MWKSRFLNFSFSVDPIYRHILEEKTVGTVSHEEQLFDCISFAVGDVLQALEIKSMLDETDFADKGSRVWKFLKQ